MLSSFDDYPIHQTSAPIAHTASADLNHYDRYFFNGYTADGSLFFALAMGLYPNRQVHDAGFSVVDGPPTFQRRGRRQTNVYASGRAPLDRVAANVVGPITVAIVEPMRVQRVLVDAPEQALRADLTFRRRTAAVEEPRFHLVAGSRTLFDYTRLTQWGTWSGWIEIDGERVDLDPATTLGSRDRSWGVRPVGERAGGAPPMPGQFYWLWSPTNFDDGCLHFDVNEYDDGRRWHHSGFWVPLGDGEPDVAEQVEYSISWRPGTRHASAFDVTLHRSNKAPIVARFEPLYEFQMAGIGYGHPQWRHGTWHGESAVGGERWSLPVTDPLAPHHVHVQALCRVTRGDGAIGTGVLEQLVVGPHQPSSFAGLLDAAPA